jgi:hypothetical protein
LKKRDIDALSNAGGFRPLHTSSPPSRDGRRQADSWRVPVGITKNPMKKSTRLIVTAAALAGLYTGSFALRARAEDTSSSSSSAKDDSKGQASDKSTTGQHGCKGQNSCKGQGGCNAGDNGCKGKNSCQGKGGCATKTDSSGAKSDSSGEKSDSTSAKGT